MNQSQDTNPDQEEGEIWAGFKGIGCLMAFALLVYVAIHVGTALIGNWFRADSDKIIETAEARLSLQSALINAFDNSGMSELRFDLRYDYSIRAYIPRDSYMRVPFPDREAVIASVGEKYCHKIGDYKYYMPRVVLCDLYTGEELCSYSCLLQSVSNK